MVTTQRYKALSGIGAGAGGALAMIAVMGLMRWLLGLSSIPEVMLNTFLNALGGRAFSDLLDKYYYSGLPLYVTMVLLGMLLVGALLGLLYARIAQPNLTTGKRPHFFNTPLAGVVYGLLIGLALNVLFLPLIGQDVFAGFSSQYRDIYSEAVIPPWLGLIVMALTFGVVTHVLLTLSEGRRQKAEGSLVGEQPTLRNTQYAMDANRRQFLRIAGGTLLALVGGAVFWYGGTVLRQGGFASPVDSKDNPLGDEGNVIEEEATPTPTPQAATATPEPPPPTSTPEPLPTNTPPIPTPHTQPTIASAEPPTSTTVPPSSTGTATATATATPTFTPTSTPTVTSTPNLPKPVAIPIREITPTGSFYHVSKNVFDPVPSADKWKLRIKGLVGNPYELTYTELTAMPAETVTVGMMCISNPIGGGLIGNTTWKGVRLADLLAKAKPKKGVVDLLMQAVDGYTDSITYQKALDPYVMLVWEMGGAPLTAEHGFPARLLVPGIYGMKHVKWLISIELVNYDYKGFWQQPSQGWNDPAPVNTMSRIDYPAAGAITGKKTVISGIAFAGDRSISKVEVSVDDGKTWRQAYVKPPASGTSWAVWGYEWTPPSAGKYAVKVRAYDGAGKLQSGVVTDPYPNGATGYHRVVYQVKG